MKRIAIIAVFVATVKIKCTAKSLSLNLNQFRITMAELLHKLCGNIGTQNSCIYDSVPILKNIFTDFSAYMASVTVNIIKIYLEKHNVVL